jgi:hypothetical protein
LIAPCKFETTQQSSVPYVVEDLALFGATSAEQLSVRTSASIASRLAVRTTAIGYSDAKSSSAMEDSTTGSASHNQLRSSLKRFFQPATFSVVAHEIRSRQWQDAPAPNFL